MVADAQKIIYRPLLPLVTVSAAARGGGKTGGKEHTGAQADPLFGNSADSFLIIWDHQ